MIRIVLLNMFLLILPALLYYTYVSTLRWIRGGNEPVDTAPLLWLFLAGMILMVASLAYYTEFSREAGRSYTPPVFRDGKVEPGRVE